MKSLDPERLDITSWVLRVVLGSSEQGRFYGISSERIHTTLLITLKAVLYLYETVQLYLRISHLLN